MSFKLQSCSVWIKVPDFALQGGNATPQKGIMLWQHIYCWHTVMFGATEDVPLQKPMVIQTIVVLYKNLLARGCWSYQ